MTTNEMMNQISKNAAAVEMANKMLSNNDRELSFGEIVELVYGAYCKDAK